MGRHQAVYQQNQQQGNNLRGALRQVKRRFSGPVCERDRGIMGYSLCRNSVHDRRNRELGERDLRHLSAIAQDNDPIGVTHQLLQFRRDNQQRQAIGAEGFNQANNFRMGADVDAAGRLIEDQELRFGQQPAGEQHLLLVAAGEKLDRLLGARGTDPQLANKALGDLILLPAGIGRSQPRCACRARTIFSRTEAAAIMPSVLRSSGQKPIPRQDA